MKNNSEPESFVKAYAVERPNGSIYMQLFLEKDNAYDYIEKRFDDIWSNIQRKHKLKIVKVEIVKRKWR